MSLSGKDGLLFVKLPPKSHSAAPTGLINTCFQLGDFLIKLLLEGEKKKEINIYIKKKKKSLESGRDEDVPSIRKPLNGGAGRTAMRKPSFVFI